tara:strand:+ start:3704 stop:3979 length:276 start_codon:yes stop_codon:yes gene_type:complete
MTTATIDNIAWIIGDEQNGMQSPIFEGIVELEEHEYAMIFPESEHEVEQEYDSDDSESDFEQEDELTNYSRYLRAYLVHEWNDKSNRASLP